MKFCSKLLLMVAFVATGFVMGACTEEEGEKNPPVLKVTQIMDNTDAIQFKVECLVQGDAASLTSLEILLDGQPAYDTEIKKEWTGKDTKTTTGALSGKQETKTATFDNGNAGKTLKFIVTDKDGQITFETRQAKVASK